MPKEVYSTEKSRAEVIFDKYELDYEKNNSETYTQYCKEYRLLNDDDADSVITKHFTNKEKIFRWYLPTVPKEQLLEYLKEFDYTVEELYDDPLMVYKVLDNDENI